jgi:uncharacterized protein
MHEKLRGELINYSKNKIPSTDPSHDINHTFRVLSLAEKICITENADIDIVTASAIFHDVINYPKNHPDRLKSPAESAAFAKKVLTTVPSFPQHKIDKVCEAIELCSFTKGLTPNFLEAKILQDADSLEALGAIAIMRTFSSAGQMNRTFYETTDPFCEHRHPDDSQFAIDLFFTRLLVVQERLHTQTAKQLASKRIEFLKIFLDELKYELGQLS